MYRLLEKVETGRMQLRFKLEDSILTVVIIMFPGENLSTYFALNKMDLKLDGLIVSIMPPPLYLFARLIPKL